MAQSFRDWVRALRVKTELSQEDFGRAVGASQTTVSQWEAGRNGPTFANLKQLAVLADVEFPEVEHFLRAGRDNRESGDVAIETTDDDIAASARARIAARLRLVPEENLSQLERFTEFLIGEGERPNDIPRTRGEAPKDAGAAEEGAGPSVGETKQVH